MADSSVRQLQRCLIFKLDRRRTGEEFYMENIYSNTLSKHNLRDIIYNVKIIARFCFFIKYTHLYNVHIINVIKDTVINNFANIYEKNKYKIKNYVGIIVIVCIIFLLEQCKIKGVLLKIHNLYSREYKKFDSQFIVKN